MQPADVIAIAQDELRELLGLHGVELLPVLARGQHIGRFLLSPTHGVAASLEQRLVAVAIADQVAAVWIPESHGTWGQGSAR
jgi:hypothetical protein